MLQEYFLRDLTEIDEDYLVLLSAFDEDYLVLLSERFTIGLHVHYAKTSSFSLPFFQSVNPVLFLDFVMSE